jgi:hypothetical protein
MTNALTPVATPSPTPAQTSTPMTTASPVAAPTEPQFSVIGAKVGYGSSNPEKMASRKSLTRVKLGQKVKLLAYVSLSSVTASSPAAIGFRITSNSKTRFFQKKYVTVDASQNGAKSFWI